MVVDLILSPDDGGGMTPERMRECMSLGFSAKSNSTNTIGQCSFSFPASFDIKDFLGFITS